MPSVARDGAARYVIGGSDSHPFSLNFRTCRRGKYVAGGLVLFTRPKGVEVAVASDLEPMPQALGDLDGSQGDCPEKVLVVWQAARVPLVLVAFWIKIGAEQAVPECCEVSVIPPQIDGVV